jgi:nitrate reductase NapAB chaperone NapD
MYMSMYKNIRCILSIYIVYRQEDFNREAERNMYMYISMC